VLFDYIFLPLINLSRDKYVYERRHPRLYVCYAMYTPQSERQVPPSQKHVLPPHFQRRPKSYQTQDIATLNVFCVNYKAGRRCTYKCNTQARSRNHPCRGKVVSINHSVWSLSYPAYILWYVTYRVKPCFSTLSHKQHDFRPKINEHKFFFDFL